VEADQGTSMRVHTMASRTMPGRALPPHVVEAIMYTMSDDMYMHAGARIKVHITYAAPANLENARIFSMALPVNHGTVAAL